MHIIKRSQVEVVKAMVMAEEAEQAEEVIVLQVTVVA